MSDPIRVAQWATGAIGKTALRGIIDRPDLELVGLYVYSDAKAGRDAGDIARRAPTGGVIATRDVDEIIRSRPQVLIHSPRLQIPYERHDDDLCRLLRAGINVITTAGQHFPPRAHGTEREHMFAQACKEGDSTLFGVGVSPGVIGERLALALTGTSIELDRITIDEVLDARGMPDPPDFAFTVMGMGSPPRRNWTEPGRCPRCTRRCTSRPSRSCASAWASPTTRSCPITGSFRHVRISTSPPDASPREPSEPPNGAGTQWSTESSSSPSPSSGPWNLLATNTRDGTNGKSTSSANPRS